VVLGTLLALMPNRQAVMVLSRATEGIAPVGPQPAHVQISAKERLPSNDE
jgi:hypothetical protein